ncbi:carboxylesterase/lipase family protein [Sphingomonas naphthae]|uniref:Carboxylic ester hydrolase n=1 Tax=Sphingomonas naphthae TaxID=1813468 RepID=A0ABY7TNF2_9SPHN|nr:carboxylesterase/lipase family protein [Sphingomonas naphthae]WCT74734.1 carboxylesterase/lipase family protein [Sphingomonas naphthae]
MIDRRTMLAGLAAVPAMAQAKIGRGPSDPVATTCHGRVRGTNDGGVLVFKGVRYGADTAPLRFARAVTPAPWRDIAPATRYGAASPQTRAEEPVSEDCLFLNVWTPGLDAGRRPVMVYFHGGAHAHGSGSDPLYDGASLVRRGDVVVVTLNHRLAAFGYAYLAQLGGPRDSGNVGNLDIVLALQWVRDNIAAFGGDPNRVMIFGQSGGGAKAVTLMAMPEARPLFHTVATMSGQHVTAAGPNHATIRAKALMKRAGVATVQELATIPYQRIVDAMAETDPLELKGEISFFSTMDHGVLPRHPFWPDAPREAAHIPLIIGNTHDETALFIEKTLLARDTTWDNLAERLGREMTRDLAPDHVVARYRQMYPERDAGQILLAAATAGRSWPGHLIQAEARAALGGPTWMYQLDFPSPEAGGILGAFHTLDIPLVFDNTAVPTARTGNSPAARKLAGDMADCFIRFARTGDPNGGGLPAWPRFDLEKRPTMIFDRTLRIENDPRREERLLFEVAPYIKPGG